VFYENTKDIKVDSQLVQEIMDERIIEQRYVTSTTQLADLFTKLLGQMEHMIYYAPV